MELSEVEYKMKYLKYKSKYEKLKEMMNKATQATKTGLISAGQATKTGLTIAGYATSNIKLDISLYSYKNINFFIL